MNFKKIYESTNSKIKNLKEEYEGLDDELSEINDLYEDEGKCPHLTQEYLFQKVYENDDMIEADTSDLSKEIDEDEAIDIATCYLQDCAVSQFEGSEENYEDADEWYEDWQTWFTSHCYVEIDDSLIEEYEGVDPSSRF